MFIVDLTHPCQMSLSSVAWFQKKFLGYMGSFTIDQLLNAIEMSDTAVTMSGHHSSGQEMY